MPSSAGKTSRRLRRISQGLFLALFTLHVCLTGAVTGGLEPRLTFPVRLLLDFDPLVALSNALATRALYQGLLWSLAILIPTIFFGRFFCGWMCPLGTLHHMVGNAPSESKRGARRIESNRYEKWQTLKYYLLIGLLASAFFGNALVGIMHPLTLFIRTLALAIYPALHVPLALRQPHFCQAIPLGLIFVAILAFNLRITRFWCRALCPLGALLGLVSRRSILGLEKRAAECGDCRRCLLHCQGGDDPIPGAAWRKSECHLCLNCVADCPERALRFRLFPPKAATRDAPDLTRRRILTSLAAGSVAVPLLRANTGLDVEANSRLIRPPGALAEKDFLARCIHCGQCMKVCPNNALHPAFAEAGWDGIWTPVLAPRVGYCEPSCTLCGEVCPTGAIWQFSLAEKGWTGVAARPIRLGTAFYDRGRCLPWAMATECIVCQEWCPTSPKAVYLRPAEVSDAEGNTRQIRQPYIDPGRCVGCGACEYACPVKGSPAVYVTSTGESRSMANQMLLPPAPVRAEWLPATGDAPGWTKSSATRQFAAEDLWKYVDGDAERYLRAGVRYTQTAAYRFRDTIEAVADVHRMESAAAATAFFESEPAAGSRPIAFGDGGRSYGQSVTIHKGPFFVRLVAYQETAETETALVGLGGAIAKRLDRQAGP